MNNLPLWKRKIIKWLAADEPVILNFCMLGTKLPDGMSLALIPADSERNSAEFYEGKTFLVPARNVIN